MRLRASRDLEFLTIVTFGRSGSTVLQAALNAHRDTLIRGENYLAARGLQEYVQSLAAAADRHHSGRPDHPWFGTARLDPAVVLESARRTFIDDVLRPKPETRWVGFKEVRYEIGYFPDSDHLLCHLLFLQDLLPGVRFVVNVRGADASQSSGWWPDNPQARDVLTATIENLRRASDQLAEILGPGRVTLVEYEQWAGDAQALCTALDAVGFPVERRLVTEVLAHRLEHGRSGG
ncbi:MAG: sulfotransferase [Actinobacteria bacterium]|nr:sulfotransferase [Actinomycetota bacterium]